MNELKSKVAYLQGLSTGMELDANTREGKLFQGIIEILDDFASTLGELEEDHDQLKDYVEDVDEDLLLLEDRFYKIKDEGTEYTEVKCPRCGETVCFDPEVLEDDDVVEITCPNCDEVVFINESDYESADQPEIMEGRARLKGEDDI